MKEMLSGAEKFNQPLASWDVSQVENMIGTFKKCDCIQSTFKSVGNWILNLSLLGQESFSRHRI
jgi:hypothetical protein